jgi:hypothetical protein
MGRKNEKGYRRRKKDEGAEETSEVFHPTSS